jgi:hypothetical protein
VTGFIVIKHKLTWMMGCTLLCAALEISAQVTDGGTAAAPNTPRFSTFEAGHTTTEQPELLQQALGDPEQRAALRADQIRQARVERPEIARVLNLAPVTEAQLFSLLGDRRLAVELRADLRERARTAPNTGFNPTLADAQEYTRHIREIGQLLGAHRLDAYLDYEQTLRHRYMVERLDAALPITAKLTSEQKDALVRVLHNDRLGRDDRLLIPPPLYASSTALGLTPQQRQRRFALRDFLNGATYAQRWADQQHEFVELARPLLLREQAAVFAAQRQALAEGTTADLEEERQNLGIALDELLPPQPQDTVALELTGTLELRLELDVNGTRLQQMLRGVRGSTVWFEAPAGLQVRARPYLSASELLVLELCFFESRDNTRHLVGRSRIDGGIGRPGHPASHRASRTSNVYYGRKGYGVTWTFSATSM